LFSATLNPKESANFELWTETGPTPVPSIDVVFAIDRTGSMSDEIAVVKNKAVSIMNDIRTKVPDSWFGLVSFMDYPGSYTYPGYSAQYGSAAYGDVPYVVNQQPTDNTADVASAINGLSIGWGADEPQDYTRVLYEVISLHWNITHKKIVILFGDAPTHDLDFAGYNFGGDPGRDAIAQTVDDLDFETVVSQVKNEGITVLAVQGSMYEPMRTYAEATFNGMSVGFDERIKKATTWALARVGSTEYQNLCLKFVQDAYEIGAGADLVRYAYAKQAADALNAENNPGVPPMGSYVFYHCWGTIDGEYRDWGHVGLSIGDGNVIHALGKVRTDNYLDIESLSPGGGWTNPQYIGWAWPPVAPIMFSSPYGATGTGGQYFQLSTADQIPGVISTMVQEEVSKIKHLTLDIPDEYKDWVTFSPAEYTDVGPLTTKTFQVTVTVPEGTAAGEHTFLIRVLGDGALLGSTEVSITIPPSVFETDLHFRPNPDGYSFDNFGTAQTWEMFEQFFGRENVRHSNGDRIYAAEQFFNQYYRTVGTGGSCDGFSSSSMINFKHLNQPHAGAFALPYYSRLYDANRDNVRNSIAYYQGYQMGYEIQNYWSIEKNHDPTYFYNKIKQYISNGNPVVIGMRDPDGPGGHAVTPYRFEEHDDVAYVYIYDNNHHGDDSKRIEFNLQENRWDYWDKWWIFTLKHWYGDATNARLSVTPISMYLNRGIPFWNPGEGNHGTVIGIDGSANMMLVNDVGNRIGFLDGQFIDETPDVVSLVPLVDDYAYVPFEAYFVPSDVSYVTEIRGTNEGNMNFTAFSNHSLIQIVNATVHPSTFDIIETGAGSISLTYTTNDIHKEYSAIIDEEMADSSRIISVKTDISSGEHTTLELTDEQGFKYTNLGQSKTYDLVLEQRGPEAGYFSLHDLEIGAGETHIIRVENWNNLGNTEIYLETDENSDGTIDEIKALTSPKTTLHIGSPQYTDTVGSLYVTSETPFELIVEDIGSGIANTAYRIHNQTYDSGWTNYPQPFNLIDLSDGSYSVDYNSTDNAGNVEPTSTATVILDNTSPTTTLTIGEPKYVSDITYVTPDTPFTLEATDTGSGVCSIAYRIFNATYDSGWITYAGTFYLASLTDGTYTIEYNSTDNVQNTETTHAINVTLFHWNYIYQDTYGRGTTLKINLAHKFFQFTSPDKDYSIRNATYMKQCGRAIIISHCDKELRLITVSVDTKMDFCYAIAWDLQTRKCYLLIDKAGIE
jgi:hypothetical protein